MLGIRANRWAQLQDGGCCRRRVRLGCLVVILSAVAGPLGLPAARVSGAGTITSTASLVPVVACTRTGSYVPQWTWTSETGFGTVEWCGLYVPSDGQLFVAANASVEVLDQSFEALLAVGIDSQTRPEAGTLRYVNVYQSAPDIQSEPLGSARPAAISALKPVSAGYHYVSFLATRYNGPGTVSLRYPTLSAIFIPANSDVRTCQVHGDQLWTTGVSDHFAVVGESQAGPRVQCTVSIPNQNGYLFISADASVGEVWSALTAQGDDQTGVTSKAIGPQDDYGCELSGHGDYQGYFRASVDGLDDRNSDRIVNVYCHDGGDGTDKTAALSVLRRVNPEQLKPGMDHTVYLAARRDASSTSTLLNVKDPTLSVIFLPDSGFTAQACGSPPPKDPHQTDDEYWNQWGTWMSGSYSFSNIRQCSASVPAGGWAFISTSASAARLPADCNPPDPDVCGPYRAEFRLGIDTTAGAEETRRLVSIYDDPAGSTPGAVDGTDEAIAIMVVIPLAGGDHTFHFVGRRLDQTGGEAFLLYPNLTVITFVVPNSRVFLPVTLEP